MRLANFARANALLGLDDAPKKVDARLHCADAHVASLFLNTIMAGV
jgi:hypothetical protein